MSTTPWQYVNNSMAMCQQLHGNVSTTPVAKVSCVHYGKMYIVMVTTDNLHLYNVK